jgi:enoyl-CoA hydratase
MPEIRVTPHDGSVVLVTIDRPEARNAFDEPLIDLFAARLGEVAALSPRAVVLTGVGEVFSAGYDVNEIDPAQADGEALPDVRFERVTRAVEALPCPVIAALNGDAFGGGLDLALACDLRLAVPTARLAMTPCRLGLVYSPIGIARFVAKLGPTLARRMYYTAAPIAVVEAAALGIAEIAEPREALLPAALALAAQIARNAPLAVRGTREAILALERAPVAALTEDERARIEALRRGAFRSDDLKEGLAAFSQKRTPRFSGK